LQRVWLVLPCALLVALGAAGSPARAQVTDPSAVAPWIEFELNAIASHATNPPRAARALAHVSSAMYLAALAGGRAPDDAVAGAASTVLAYLYPDQAAQIQALTGQLADVGGNGFARGRVIGRLLVARAQADRSDDVWTGTVRWDAAFGCPLLQASSSRRSSRSPERGRHGTCKTGRSSAPAPHPASEAVPSGPRFRRCMRSHRR
jgi:hypothetical protein